MDPVQIFKTLADQSRLRILQILRQGAFNVQELTNMLSLSQSTVSHHLKSLQNAGLTKQKKEGTWVYYTLVDMQNEIYNFVSGICDFLQSQKQTDLNQIFESDSNNANELLRKRQIATKSFFETSASNWDVISQYASTEQNTEWLKQLAESINPLDDLLEMGCGTGALLKQIIPRIGKTIAVDYSEAMLGACRKNISSKYHPQIDLRLGYLEHLPVADAEVDQAVCYMVLHYLSEPLAAFKSAYRVLKAGGNLKIVDLNQHQNEILRDKYAHQWLGFTEKELKSWAKQAGFTDLKYSLQGKGNEAFFLTCTKK